MSWKFLNKTTASLPIEFQQIDFDPTHCRHSGGFGFRAGAAGFVLRIDLGFNLDPEDTEPGTVFHFEIGQAL